MTDAPTVVSTSPSGTEILSALGVEPAAVSGACDHPPSVRDLPRLDRSRVDGESSAERDEQAASSRSVYEVDESVLRETAPDLVLTQSVCGVCAVDEGRIRQHLGDLPVDPEVIGLDASTVGDVLDCVETVGAAVGREDRAARLVDQVTDCFDALESITAGGERPTVAVVEWPDPLHLSANWVPELVEYAGGRYPFADPGERSVEPDWETVREVDPDVVLVAPCSYSLEETLAAMDELTDRPGWADLSAVRNDRVFALGGQALNRWTPRLAGECERLATVLRPERFEGDPVATRV